VTAGAIEIIPAIDLSGGRCVRLLQGDFAQETVFSDDPVAVAREWERRGGRRLHLVDLDGARIGEPQNWEVVERIVAAIAIPVELGGGLRRVEIIERALAAGVDRVCAGTAAALDPGWTRDACARFGERLALDVAARQGRVAIRGWQEVTDRPVIEFARELEALGARRIVFTEVARDGAMRGVNVESVRAMAAAVSIPVIASGGVTTADDVRALRDTGVEGCIIGRALYEGTLTIEAALEAARGRHSEGSEAE
jgi:phosphoribosylformimino-5-aminoimidazole carboxamide ribotide isomerase